jgi:hypothetical protein
MALAQSEHSIMLKRHQECAPFVNNVASMLNPAIRSCGKALALTQSSKFFNIDRLLHRNDNEEGQEEARGRVNYAELEYEEGVDLKAQGNPQEPPAQIHCQPPPHLHPSQQLNLQYPWTSSRAKWGRLQGSQQAHPSIDQLRRPDHQAVQHSVEMTAVCQLKGT